MTHLTIIPASANDLTTLTHIETRSLPGTGLDGVVEISFVQVTEDATHRLHLAARHEDGVDDLVQEWLTDSGWTPSSAWHSTPEGRALKLAVAR